MKALLDENLDPRLKNHINSDELTIEIFSIKDMKWLGLKNGELLTQAIKERFDIFISADRQLKHQQNLPAYNINVIVFKLVKNNFPNQLLKIPELIKIAEKISFDKINTGYFEI